MRMDRKQSSFASLTLPYSNKTRPVSLDPYMKLYRKKLTINDTTKKPPLLFPKKHTSLTKHMAASIVENRASLPKTRKSYLQTIVNQKRQFKGQEKHIKAVKSIDLSTVMDENGKQLSNTFNKGIKLFQNGQISGALLQFQTVQSYVNGLNSNNLYWLANCYFKLTNYNNAIKYFNASLQQYHPLPKQGYLILAQCYKRTHNYLCAISVLDKCIKHLGPLADIYLHRARLQVTVKNYEAALLDYELSLQLDCNSIQAQVERADIIYYVSGLKQAIQCYNEILLRIIQPQDRLYVIYRKAILYMQQKQYAQAIKHFQLVTSQNCLSLQSEINYYIGIIQTVLGKRQEAIISYQQSINFNTSEKFVKQSTYEKLILLLKKKDYYGAQYELERVTTWSDDIKNLKIFIDGIISILKMKLTKGIRLLSEAIIPRGFENIVKSFRSYAFFVMRDFEKALKEIEQIQGKLCEANLYNKAILQAIIALNKKNFKKCLNYIDQAHKQDQSNLNIDLLRALCHIELYKNSPTTNNKKILQAAQQLLVKLASKDNQNDSIPYFSAMIYYELGEYQTGLQFIRMAIDVSEDHMIKHYYLKAHLKLQLDMLAEAANDFNNAIIVANEAAASSIQEDQDNLEKAQKQIEQCLFFKAQCKLKMKLRNQAQQDLRNYFSKIENVTKMQKYIYYLMHAGLPETILTVYKDLLKKQIDVNLKIQACYLAKQLNECLAALKQKADKFQSPSTEYDWHALGALKAASYKAQDSLQTALQTFNQLVLLSQNEKIQGQMFKQADCYFYQGFLNFELQKFEIAREKFLLFKKIKENQGKLIQIGDQQNVRFQNRILCMQEINYNIGLTYLLDGEIDEAQKYLKPFTQFDSLISKLKSKAIFQDSQHQSQISKQGKQITPFPIYNRLCSIFDPIRLKDYLFRLSFCLPQIKIQPIRQGKWPQMIQSIGLADIPMRPNAPWIKKNTKGIIFTDNLIPYSVQLKSQRSQANSQLKKQQVKDDIY